MAIGLAVLAAVLAAGALAWWWRSSPGPRLAVPSLPATCHDRTFEGVSYVVCAIDPRGYDVKIHWADAAGKPFGSLQAFDSARAVLGEPVLLAMNAGMYHKDLSPVGLLVEAGRTVAPLNADEGEGNFFLKPNGVFFVRPDGTAGVMETSAFAARAPDVAYATQSGPMLVVDGALHPRFEENGASRYVRNGAGVDASGVLHLAISRSEVSLGSFGRLFRDGLQCPNALFFDGAISALSDGSLMIVGGTYPVGPILAVTAKQ